MTRFKEKCDPYDIFQGRSVTPMTRFKKKRYSYDMFQGKSLLL